MPPPANSPDDTPPVTSTAASPYLEELNVIASPVPDFAATLLSTSPEHEIEMESTTPTSPASRQRVPVSSSSTLSRTHPTRQPYLTEEEFRHFTAGSRRRMHRNIEAARHAPTASSYADRSTSRQSLYDWAASESDDSEDDVRRHLEAPLIPELQRGHEINEDNQDGWRDLEEALSSHRRRRNQSRREPGNNDPASRGATLPFWNDDLQSAQAQRRDRQSYASAAAAANAQAIERSERRRQERIMSLLEGSQSQRLRNRVSRERILTAMEGFMVDRDRRNQNQARDDSTASASRSAYGATLHRSERVSEIMKESQRYRSSKVRNMVEYLSRVRSHSPAALAKELDVAKTIDPDDIVAETRSIEPPPWSSLLTPGATFTGSQHAPHDPAGAHLLSRDRDYLRRMVANRNLSSAHLPGSIATLVDAERYLLDHSSASTSTSRAPDHWPVSVTLHTVDMEKCTLTGTMSANHIPDKFAPGSPEHRPEGSSMMSYFEGEIVDLNLFTLETEQYKKEGVGVDIEVDVEYWRQIGPFREEIEKCLKEEGLGMGKGSERERADERLATCLGRRSWVERRIGREWILMRWKERCFLPPSDTNSWGLTISGFYYIAMHRESGRIEGLYYDPGSQPYQRLDLTPAGARAVHTGTGMNKPAKEGSDLGAGGVRKWFPSVEFGSEGYRTQR